MNVQIIPIVAKAYEYISKVNNIYGFTKKNISRKPFFGVATVLNTKMKVLKIMQYGPNPFYPS